MLFAVAPVPKVRSPIGPEGAPILTLGLARLSDALIFDHRLLVAQPSCLVLRCTPMSIAARLAVHTAHRLPGDAAVFVDCDERDAAHLACVAYLGLWRPLATSASSAPTTNAASTTSAAERCSGWPIATVRATLAFAFSLPLTATLAATLALACPSGCVCHVQARSQRQRRGAVAPAARPVWVCLSGRQRERQPVPEHRELRW